MDVVWAHQPVSIREVIDHLGTAPAYTTIATVLANLENKGLVRRVKEGRSKRYVALVDAHEHAARLMEDALADSADRGASILHFVESISEADRELLRDYLRRREED